MCQSNSLAPMPSAGHIVPDALLTLGIRVAAILAQLATFALVARTHVIADVGIFALSTTAFFLARVLGPMGYDYTAFKFCPHFLLSGDVGAVTGFARRFSKLVRNVAFAGALLLGAVALFAALAFPDKGPAVGGMLAVAAGVPAYALLGFFSALHRARGAIVWSQFPDGILIPVVTATGVLAVQVVLSTNIVLTVALQAAAGWLAAAVSYWRWQQFAAGHTDKLSVQDESQARQMARGVFAMTVLTNVSLRVPVFIVSGILGGAATALFDAAQRFGTLSTLTTYATNTSAAPLLAKARSRGDNEDVQNIFTLASLMQTLPAAFILIFHALFGEWLLVFILGDQFAPAYWPLLFMALMALVNALGGAASPYLLMNGGERIMVKYSLYRLVIVVLGTAICAAFFGLGAVVLVLVAGTVVRDIGMTIHAVRTYGIKPGVLSMEELARGIPLLMTQGGSILQQLRSRREEEG